MNLAHLLARSARVFPERPALAHGEREICAYGELAQRVAALAGGLCGKLALIGRHAVIATVDRKKEPIFKWPMPELLDPLAASKPFITRRVLV